MSHYHEAACVDCVALVCQDEREVVLFGIHDEAVGAVPSTVEAEHSWLLAMDGVVLLNFVKGYDVSILRYNLGLVRHVPILAAHLLETHV